MQLLQQSSDLCLQIGDLGLDYVRQNNAAIGVLGLDGEDELRMRET